jgi:hypothetical protein
MYFLKADPSRMTDEEWAQTIKILENIRKTEAGSSGKF